jgi:hypothetical protein
MHFRYFLRSLAVLTIGLSAIVGAASNQDAILGRWYTTISDKALVDPSPFLDIFEDKFVFEGDSTYYTTLLATPNERHQGESTLVFKLTGEDHPVDAFAYGCAGPVVLPP